MTILPIQRICPRCRAANAAEATICRACGANINDRLVVTRLAGVTLPAITRREVGATLAMTAAAVALRLGRRWLAAWRGQRETPAASPSQIIPASEPKSAGFTVTRKTWWHVSDSDGSSQWGSQQDTWDIEPR